jgi:hypothetical protein
MNGRAAEIITGEEFDSPWPRSFFVDFSAPGGIDSPPGDT